MSVRLKPEYMFTEMKNKPKYKGDISKRERDYEMKTMYDAGMTYESIADFYKISKQRVQKIIEQAKRNQYFGL